MTTTLVLHCTSVYKHSNVLGMSGCTDEMNDRVGACVCAFKSLFVRTHIIRYSIRMWRHMIKLQQPLVLVGTRHRVHASKCNRPMRPRPQGSL
uniref:Uncharacterized protein n=1 Tax=Arundo donax TaxID=35708 RepID=A0A0A9C269_ARUDO